MMKRKHYNEVLLHLFFFLFRIPVGDAKSVKRFTNMIVFRYNTNQIGFQIENIQIFKIQIFFFRFIHIQIWNIRTVKTQIYVRQIYKKNKFSYRKLSLLQDYAQGFIIHW